MVYKYYDNFSLDKIVKVLNTNPYYALSELERYISEFPADYIAYTYYIKVLVDVGRFDDALSVVEFVENSNLKTKIDIHFLFGKLRALVFKEKYDEAYDLYMKYKEGFLEKDLRAGILEYIYAQRNGCDCDTSNYPKRNAYFFNQYVDYSEEEFLNHIKKHLASCNDEVDILTHTVFNPDFPYYKVIDEIKELIPNDKRLHYSFFNDLYVFKYDFCGRSDNKNTDYFRVICTHDTNHLITMYPYACGDLVPYTDINYLNNQNCKVRKLSQIDKFNQRYGK